MENLLVVLSATLLATFIWNIFTIVRMDSKSAKDTGYIIPSSQYYYTIYNYLLRAVILYIEVKYVYLIAEWNLYALVFLVMFLNTLLATVLEVITRVLLLQVTYKLNQDS